MLAIRVDQLTKVYGNFRALDQCCLEVKQGQVFGLLGPNGAGKTTLIRVLLGFLEATSGEASIFGKCCRSDSEQVRAITSYLPAEAKLFRSMRGKDVLQFFASFHPKGDAKRSVQLADRLQLDLSRRVAFMSTGMRQKLALAIVFGCKTELLILDEPTANLDPSVRHEVLRLILEGKSDGKTILFCSHVLQEVEEICDQAAIARAGKVVHAVTLSELKSVHRLSGNLVDDTADQSIGRTMLDQIPTTVRFCSQIERRVIFDILGPIENHWDWIKSLPLLQVQVEPIGLRSVYEKYHGPSSSSQESA